MQIWRNFGLFQTLTADICGMNGNINLKIGFLPHLIL